MIETVRRAGVGGASARAIGRTGGFDQALTFCHFGSLPAALLAVARPGDDPSPEALAGAAARLPARAPG